MPIGVTAADATATTVTDAATAVSVVGLFAISLGLSRNYPDDLEMLEQGFVLYDALYAWCRELQHERHGWPPAAG